MAVTQSELLLALRAPDAGWLGVLTCVLDEAAHDPSFDARQRELLAELLDMGRVPEAVAAAARDRAARFENELYGRQAGLADEADPVAQRPKLTLVDTGTA